MDLQLAYNQIDEYFSKYIESGNEEDKSKMKMLKLICDVINSDFKYKKYFDNCTFDYLPVLNAINDSIKYYRSNDDSHPFHNYLFSNIRKAVNKYIEEIELQYKNNLNYSNRQLLKKIKKLLPLYQDHKQKVAEALEISIEKIDELLYSQVDSLDKEIKTDDSVSTVADFVASEELTTEEAFESKEKLQNLFNQFDSAWKEIKPIHQGVVSDWLTALILSILEKPDYVSFMEDKDEAFSFFSKFDFINRAIVNFFYNERDYILPLTFEAVGQIHGITKSAVYKKILVFSGELKIHLKNLKNN